MKLLSILLCVLTNLSVLGFEPLSAAPVDQKANVYIDGFSYFDTAPKVNFTVEDYARTNKSLAAHIHVLIGEQYQKDKLLQAYVVPIIDSQQYNIIICSVYPLTPSDIRSVDKFVENSMFTK
jgi:hypothetical protein